ncbi:MAG: hypothetical protein R3B68_00780 [Phycisphaerales bacterium]
MDHEHTPEHHEPLDEWHQHAASEGSPQVEHGSAANPFILLAVFVISVIFLVAFVGATIVYAKGYISTRRAIKSEVTVWAGESRAARATAERRLESYGWVNATDGHVRVPIESVMAEMAGGHEPAHGGGE